MVDPMTQQIKEKISTMLIDLLALIHSTITSHGPFSEQIAPAIPAEPETVAFAIKTFPIELKNPANDPVMNR
jgi:hypothetical protein